MNSRFNRAAQLVFGVYVIFCLSTAADAVSSYDAIRYEAGCGTQKDERSPRQTLVVFDEAIVSQVPDENLKWTRILVEAADARDTSVGTLGARERFSIFVARRDGTELLPLFVGCSPNVSSSEFERMKSQDSAVDRFLGHDSEARRKSSRDEFANALARALGQIRKQASDIGAQPTRPGTLIHALQNAGHLVDLNQGVPRFVMITPFTLDPTQVQDIRSARKSGFETAERTQVDLGRAEVYISGANLTDAALEFARAFVLGSKGSLIGVRSDGLPRLQPEPADVRVYAGFIDYVGQRVPVQLRFVTTSQGDLVNAWIEATVSQTVATPIGGKAICQGGNCEVRGDGRFAQVWFLDPQNDPTSSDRRKFPFAGARNFEMMLDAKGAKGRVWDPKVFFVSSDEQHAPLKAEELRFEIERKEGFRF